MPEPAVLITCEHAVNQVPAAWRALFAGRAEVLSTHRAYDPGALVLARHLARASAAPCFAAQVTRLLVDHNRSLRHPALWSEFSRGLSAVEKTRLIDDYYRPFREAVGAWVEARLLERKRILHISVHSFTPVWHGRQRPVDIGVLYDPGRSAERRFGRLWQRELKARAPALRVRCNAPYRGRSDCHQTIYRNRLKSRVYLGVELEVNQSLTAAGGNWGALPALLATSLTECLLQA